jgi:hypothetical protein
MLESIGNFEFIIFSDFFRFQIPSHLTFIQFSKSLI